jgi:hypothetical protein
MPHNFLTANAVYVNKLSAKREKLLNQAIENSIDTIKATVDLNDTGFGSLYCFVYYQIFGEQLGLIPTGKIQMQTVQKVQDLLNK